MTLASRFFVCSSVTSEQGQIANIPGPKFVMNARISENKSHLQSGQIILSGNIDDCS